MLSSIKYTSKNSEYKQIFRAVWRYLYHQYLQQEIFTKQRLRSVRIYCSLSSRQAICVYIEENCARMIIALIALDLNTSSDPLPAFSFAAVSLRIYNLALLLIHNNLTQLVSLHNIRRRISCERVVSVFVT